MGRIRKYQVSVGLSSDLIDMIEDVVEKGEYRSRSHFIETLIRQNIEDECIPCKINDKLRHHGINTNYIQFPITMSEADELIENQKTGRGGVRREKLIMEIVAELATNNGGIAQLLDVYNEAERYDLDRSTAEDIIETLCQLGRMLRPSGYDTLQIS
jgi:Arc/MetJ-type ribon-helix-helix transcriptional regulator